jgi:hypothetical protein
MKTKASVLAFALFLAATIAIPARAQTTIISTGPIGIVGWTERAADCRIVRGAGLATLNSGTVTFRANSFGTITLECQPTAIMRVDPTAINALGLTFRNDNGFVGGVDHCLLSVSLGAYPYNGGLPILVTDFSTAGQSFTGVETSNTATTATLTYDTNMYLVSVALVRNTGATCNPIAVAAFLEDVIQ